MEFHKCAGEIFHNAVVKVYPDGGAAVLVADKPIFREAGYEETTSRRKCGGGCAATPEARRAESIERAKRRARAAVADYARCNSMRWFVTFTLDRTRVDRYDISAVLRTLNRWLDNRVRRDGLKYVMVPELHKDGAIHFHGLFSDSLRVVDSGTLTLGGGKPRRPRGTRERAKMLAAGAHVVYNVVDWPLGFSTALELYGDYDAAVGYVCKYISKAADKVGGRWYYSGGGLKKPARVYTDLDFDEAAAAASGSFRIPRLAAECVQIRIDGGIADGACFSERGGVPRPLEPRPDDAANDGLPKLSGADGLVYSVPAIWD